MNENGRTIERVYAVVQTAKKRGQEDNAKYGHACHLGLGPALVRAFLVHKHNCGPGCRTAEERKYNDADNAHRVPQSSESIAKIENRILAVLCRDKKGHERRILLRAAIRTTPANPYWQKQSPVSVLQSPPPTGSLVHTAGSHDDMTLAKEREREKERNGKNKDPPTTTAAAKT